MSICRLCAMINLIRISSDKHIKSAVTFIKRFV